MTKKTRAGSSGAREADPTLCSVIFPSGEAEAVAETQVYYGLLRQRAAERPMQSRFFSSGSSSAEKREVWSKQGEFKRETSMSMTEALISALESEPHVDEHKKLSILAIVWSLLQCEMDDGSAAHIASIDDKADRARQGKKLAEREAITKRLADDFISIHPNASNSRIAEGILECLNLELTKSSVPLMRSSGTLRKLLGAIFKKDPSKEGRPFQKRLIRRR
jgi:hypothetical protein